MFVFELMQRIVLFCKVWVKNLSTRNPTVVNEVPTVGEKLLSHGDNLEIGGRLARWEYLPDSKYYSTNRPVINLFVIFNLTIFFVFFI